MRLLSLLPDLEVIVARERDRQQRLSAPIGTPRDSAKKTYVVWPIGQGQAVLRPLTLQAHPKDVPPRWQLAAKEPRQQQARDLETGQE
jgi:hypothetical protein